MNRERWSSFGISFAIHAALAGLLAWIAVDQVFDRPPPEPTELELIELPLARPTLPEPPPTPVAEPPAPAPKPRPVAVPETARVVKVDRALPFAPEIETSGTRDAPAEVEAVDRPITTMVFAMDSEVGGGSGDYVSDSQGGTMPVAAAGVGGPGRGGGQLGTTNSPGRTDLRVARDWQVTVLPEPLNDRDGEPHYPPLAKREGREAVVLLELMIDAAGAVDRASVLRGPRGHGFRESALAYARTLRFKPARAGDRPVAARIEWTVYFYVRN